MYTTLEVSLYAPFKFALYWHRMKITPFQLPNQPLRIWWLQWMIS